MTKSWQVLYLCVALLGVAAATTASESDHHDDDCHVGTDKLSNYAYKLKGCFDGTISDESLEAIRAEGTMENIRRFLDELCHNVGNVTTCVAGVRNRVNACPKIDKNTLFGIGTELLEHLMADGCENDGDRLAYLLRGVYLLTNKNLDELLPLRRCVHKTMVFYKLADNDDDVDIASMTHLTHNEIAKLKKCDKYIEDEHYKTAFQWIVEEISTKMKCSNPEEDHNIVPCSQVNPSSLNFTDICQVKPLSQHKDNLYDYLENLADIDCTVAFFNHDQEQHSNHTDLDWLKGEYKELCKLHRDKPACLWEASAFGDACLQADLNKHYQLVVEAIHDYMGRLCVEDGEFFANIMHEMYTNAAEHGNAFKACVETFDEYTRKDEQHKASAKDMQYYHDTEAYNRCVLGKLHANNDIASGLERAFEDIMKKMRCINPENGEAVLCETIHTQHHH